MSDCVASTSFSRAACLDLAAKPLINALPVVVETRGIVALSEWAETRYFREERVLPASLPSAGIRRAGARAQASNAAQCFDGIVTLWCSSSAHSSSLSRTFGKDVVTSTAPAVRVSIAYSALHHRGTAGEASQRVPAGI